MSKKSKTVCKNLSTLIIGRKYNASKLEAILPHSHSTCQRKLADPKRLTVEDLLLIAADKNITASELVEALGKDMK